MIEHADTSKLKLLLLFDPGPRSAGNWYGREVDSGVWAALRYTLLVGPAGRPIGGDLAVNITWVERERADEPWEVAGEMFGIADASDEGRGGRCVYTGTVLLGRRWGRKRYLRPVLGLSRAPVGIGMHCELVADPGQIAAALAVHGVSVIVGGPGDGQEGML